MTDHVLYGFAASTYVRTVRMALAAKGVDYDHVPVDLFKGENRSPEHLARHPFGKIPAFEAHGTMLYETPAILEMIEGKHPEPALFPADVTERARMRQWMSVIDNYVYPTAIGKVVWQRLIVPMLGETGDDQIVQDALPDLRHQLGLFDRQLASSRHLAGDAFSAADAYLAPILAYLAQTPEADSLLGEAPNLKRWWDAMQARDSFQKTAP
jgi:glutathione S-transferase